MQEYCCYYTFWLVILVYLLATWPLQIPHRRRSFANDVFSCSPSATTASGTHAPSQICAGELIFEDNFDSLDFKVWEHESTLAGGGNWEFQWYTNNRLNSIAEGGLLKIKPTLTADDLGEAALSSATLDLNGGAPADACTNPSFYGCSRTGAPSNILNPIKSARLRTVNSFSFKYGRIEISAKVPAGDWLWPAIWLLPRDNAYGYWPISGEIDIMESRGNRNLQQNGANIGVQKVASTLHWGPDFYNNAYPRTHWEDNNAAGFDQGFHKYEVLWTPTFLTFRVDGRDIGTVSPPAGGFWQLGEFANTGRENPWKSGTLMAPFDQEFYIILNLAVGGVNYFPDDVSNPGGKPWSNTSPQAATDFWNNRNQWLPTWNSGNGDTHLQVDYVRVYAL